MTEFNAEIKNLVNFQKLGYVATVSPDGTPNLSPKGTIAILDDSRLVFANIRSPKTIENLTKNPSIEINVIDPFSRLGYRFKGLAQILSNGKDFENILDYFKQKGIKSSISHIVVVDVTSFSEITSPSYDLGLKKEDLVKKWKQYYD
ncbi:MAG: pyridoxamine 5'-phosphate oxidase family protein [Thermoproteota archaeon]|jgi:predicted pyridoxine 5'-phosphate oxidase superfamily flavin-nucleotide-binding protein|nr:pyridoxamine 5'-phosphate oxidase family protein [Thermoproteota archaeon]MED5543329.1 pyridoxamine 5'-phosphate oxidase family protein [Thermoproteota archaeon]|tara:strand:- start:1198 stop:1638 length:441 start_codon:yes stop_codon:yes gene_type:complete